MSGRLAAYENKTTIDYEHVAAMEVVADTSVKVVFKSGAVVVMTGYEGLATGFQNYVKLKYGAENEK